jgi:hypothetical protein
MKKIEPLFLNLKKTEKYDKLEQKKNEKIAIM